MNNLELRKKIVNILEENFDSVHRYFGEATDQILALIGKCATPTFSGGEPLGNPNLGYGGERLCATEQKEDCRCKETSAYDFTCVNCGKWIGNFPREQLRNSLCKTCLIEKDCETVGIINKCLRYQPICDCHCNCDGADRNIKDGKCLTCGGKTIPAEKKECEHKVISSSTLSGKLNNLNCVNCGKDFMPNIKPEPKPKDRIEELIKREKEIIEMLQTLCVSPYPLLPESLHWCWYEAINYFKKELLKRIQQLIRHINKES